jgi:hypothetical protein
MARKQQSIRTLRVVLDTSAIFTQVAHELVTAEIAQLIQGNSAHPDLKISWHLPETVIEERAFQMKEKAAALLPSIEKVEKLLGLKLAITKDTLDDRVNAAIDSQLLKFNIQVASLDVESVEWRKIITSAVRREAPFQPGEKEKGFRDSLILESFVQLADASPRTLSVCRIVLVAADGLLGSAAQARISQYSNVQILSSVDELKNLINTLASQVDENFVNEMQEKARLLFFYDLNDKDTLYYKEKIRDQITDKFSKVLKTPPEGADTTESEGISIARPRFVKKEGQRISWISSISFSYKAYRFEPSVEQATYLGLLGNAVLPAGNVTATTWNPYIHASAVGGTIFPSQTSTAIPMNTTIKREKRLLKSGRHIFEVNWSVTVDAKKKLSRPEINEIVFSETSWE